MSVDWSFVEVNYKRICKRFVRPPFRTMMQIAAELDTTYHNVSAALRKGLPEDVIRRRSGANKSRSKKGALNPLFGTRRKTELVWRKGYATKWNGHGYTQVHRSMFAKALRLKHLPRHLEVHHIDGDRTNNKMDNLALATKRGHQQLHRARLKKLKLWELEEYGTSRLKKITATLRKG